MDVFNVQDNIFMGREIQRRIFGVISSLNHAEMRRRTVEIFHELGLPQPDLNKKVRLLSGGQCQAAARISSGATIAIGGSLLRRQPMALVREIVRQGKRDLTLLTSASTMATDLLAAAGAVRRLEGIYVGFFQHACRLVTGSAHVQR